MLPLNYVTINGFDSRRIDSIEPSIAFADMEEDAANGFYLKLHVGRAIVLANGSKPATRKVNVG